MMNKSLFKKIVYFDFTGTLMDPFINIKNILNVISKEKGFKHFEELQSIKKMSPLTLLNTFGVPDSDKKSVVKEVLLRLENEIESIPPIPGIQNLIYFLQKQNYYLGILSSNRQANIKKWLATNKIDIFDDIICTQFQENKTPYLKTIKNKFSSHSTFLFVSDEAKDLIQAQEAGFAPIGVTWGFDASLSLQEMNPKAILSTPKEFIFVSI